MNRPPLQTSLIRFALGFGVWTLIGLAFASQLYLTQSKLGNPVSWGFAAGRALADWYVFAVLSLPAFWIARRFPLEAGLWPRNAGIHFLCSTVFSLSWMFLRAGVQTFQLQADDGLSTFEAAFRHALFATFFFNLLIYWVIVSVSHTFQYYRRFHERELRSADLEKRLTEARLQALQMQLNPHFLFNSLHAISSLMHKDVEAADRMLARLSELLRYALESTDAQEVSLKQELKFLERYLEIEQTRFGDRLSIQKQIDPGATDAFVPNLILQPLLENAIQHGVEQQARPGIIQLSARRQEDRLLLEVRDNGAGLPPGQSLVEGVGLSNTRARLQQLYDGSHRFLCQNAPEGGFVVSVTIPFRTSQAVTPKHGGGLR
jgi:signal transduction histidine kinase